MKMSKILSEQDQERVSRKFESFKKSDYTDKDFSDVFGKEKQIKSKSSKGALAEHAEDVHLFFSMLHDYFAGKYARMPRGTISATIFTLIYVFAPVDLIPDFLPIIGLTDDAAMLALCTKFISSDLKKYKTWKSKLS